MPSIFQVKILQINFIWANYTLKLTQAKVSRIFIKSNTIYIDI